MTKLVSRCQSRQGSKGSGRLKLGLTPGARSKTSIDRTESAFVDDTVLQHKYGQMHIQVREYERHLSATVNDDYYATDALTIKDVNPKPSPIDEEIARLRLACEDYRTQIRLLKAQHAEELLAYKKKVQREYEAASQKFRDDSMIIAREKQKLFEIQMTNKYNETKEQNAKLALELKQVKHMLTKQKEDMSLEHELHLGEELSRKEREHKLKQQAALDQLRDELNGEFLKQRTTLKDNFDRQLERLLAQHKKKVKEVKPSKSTQTDAVQDDKKPTKPKTPRRTTRASISKPRVATVKPPPPELKANPLQSVIEIKEHQIRRMVEENAYLRERLMTLSGQMSDLKHKLSIDR